MSFKMGAPWNIWMLLAFGFTLLLALVSPVLAQRSYRRVRIFAWAVVSAAVLVYAFISIGGLLVFGGRASLEGIFFVVPVLSPMILIVSRFSTRWGAFMAGFFFVIAHSYYSWLNWPSLYGIAMATSFDWPILLAASAFSIISWQDKQRTMRQMSTLETA